jgi:selenocysteine lyase/cysteine desulfurase
LSASKVAAAAISEDISDALFDLASSPLAVVTTDEDLWSRIQQAYTVSANIVNLNNGGVSPQPKVVQDAVDRYYHLSNEAPSYYMWRILDKGREAVRRKLADLAKCSPESIAINRNATEALDNAIFGIDLKKGDEVILTKQDYPNMINAWKQREARDGVKLKWLNFDLPVDHQTVFSAFESAISSRTKVLHITHMINWTGHLFPVKELCNLASERGLISIVDGAHTFAHIDFGIEDLGCDYFGTSLHKWLCAPFGTGMLYVSKDKIEKTWPLLPSHINQSSDIRKFEGLGTRSFAPEQAIGQAIDFHNAIGSKRKEERLRYLRNYWVNATKNHPRFILNTSLEEEYSCAIANFRIDGIDSGKLSSILLNDYQIHTTSIKWENIDGVRVTPHVYTLAKDLDRLIDAINQIAEG